MSAIPKTRDGRAAPRPVPPRTLQQTPRTLKRVFVMTWDALSWILAALLLLVVRYDFQLSPDQWNAVLVYVAASVVLQWVTWLTLQTYRGRRRLGSFADVTSLAVVVLGNAVVLGLVFTALIGNFSGGVAIFLPPLALLFMVMARCAYRYLRGPRRRGASEDVTPALVYGAGNVGTQIAELMEIADDPQFEVVGFLDDDRNKHDLRISNARVLATGEGLTEAVKRTNAKAVILAVTEASPALIQRVHDQCHRLGVEVVVIPPLREMAGGRVTLDSLRKLDVTDLLGRRPISTDLESISSYITGKTVLITGAGGSIGSELAVQVHRLGPKQLVLLDRDESALHGVQLALHGNGLLNTDDIVLCDIRDEAAVREVFERHRPDVVFHAAALKHLPLLERFPLEGWKTNVLGTRAVLRAAHAVGVERFVNVSTDKAAAPSSVLGRTKRLAERLTSWFAIVYGVPYLSVRFGNVLGSRGSVLISFRKQIEQGGPLTVTDPKVTRYFMTIPEACELVLQAGAIGRPGDVLVLDMGEPVKILDVAERMIAESGQDIEIHFTGLREGEKMHEVLFSTLEDAVASDHPLISEVQVPPFHPDFVRQTPMSEDELADASRSADPSSAEPATGSAAAAMGSVSARSEAPTTSMSSS